MTSYDNITDFPGLRQTGDDSAEFASGPLDPACLTALSIRALEHHARSVSEAGEAQLVSVSTDVTGTAHKGGDSAIVSRIDRQTRTLLFMGAELTSDAGLHIRATAIFRLDTA
jgi:hypothetical protein